MLSENIKNLRKAKGLSQDELAIKLNVVRQTVSKWEKGLSVPDCEMLINLAEALGTSVNVLLDETVHPEDSPELSRIANKLEVINEQILKHYESRRKIWRVIFVIAAVLSGCVLLACLLGFVNLLVTMNNVGADVSIIGGADGPTAIFVTSAVFRSAPFLNALVVAVVSVVGICKTRKK
jgi:putative transcriptional regulator